jgi:hypothetical protein
MMPHDEHPRGTNDAALGDPVDIRRRVKDHARIILQHPDPARDVRDVLPTVVADADLLAQHQRSHLGGKRFRRSSPQAPGRTNEGASRANHAGQICLRAPRSGRI